MDGNLFRSKKSFSGNKWRYKVYVIPLIHAFGDRPDEFRTVQIRVYEDGKTEVDWFFKGTFDLLNDPDYYECIGGIDVERLIAEAVLKVENYSMFKADEIRKYMEEHLEENGL